MTSTKQVSKNGILTSVTALKGVGAQLAKKLEKLGIYTLQDMLFHLPRQYADRTRVTPIGSLQPNQSVVIEAEVRGTDVVFGKRRSLICRVQDNTGTLSLRFYHFSNAQRATLATGARIRCYGETRRGASGLELYHPEYQLLSSNAAHSGLEETLTPIYPITEGITQNRLRTLIKQALTHAKDFDFRGYLALLPADTPEESAPAISLPNSLFEPLAYLHAPPKNADLAQLLAGEHPYQQVLIMEELTAYQLNLLRLREQRQQQAAVPLAVDKALEDQFIQALGFTLTNAQQRVVEDISQDLRLSIPMMRLLQGDVGSGKTVVAALAALHAIAHQQQVVIMAPTEILAEQHRLNFEKWFSPLGICVGSLTGKQKVKERREQLAALEQGVTQVVIGTHALFQDSVVFNRLALVIIDEQHRFGVHQRLSLRNKGNKHTGIPHQLIMTATPIPRTLAMSAYADLDYSVIDELPKGRIPVETVIISQQKRPEIIQRIDYACQQGRQAYWVCTLIENSEALEAQAAEEAATLLASTLPNLTVGLVHGRLKPPEKEQVMAQFKAGEIDLLVATTVIEVGVDVPNASLMIIENPERLGLAQLHQLRGRVGRGSIASHCVLLYGDKVSLNGKERLKAMRSTSDGFKIAEVDLQLRGPGEVLGTRQTGDIDFALADLRRDLYLMPKVNAYAQAIITHFPEHIAPLSERWLGKNTHYAQA
ncbi:ATP-dependent DNA helicase RecG [gamma proteobacterium IMCC1989]|nr:ATP-dependent DNA helicase RecG [gamma proteobacterium IMCC1989]